MRRIDQIVIRDAACRAILTSRYSFPSAEARDAAADVVLSSVSDTPGLLRYSLYRGLDEPTLLELSQWSDPTARDGYATKTQGVPHAIAGKPLQELTRDWRHLCDQPHRSFVRASAWTARCLVVVRQPLLRADPQAGREWIDSVMEALEEQSPDGLCAATFFVSIAADVGLNFAEWTSAEAHRLALTKADFGRYGSIGDTEAWRKVRAHPAISRDHEVRRYALVTALEP